MRHDQKLGASALVGAYDPHGNNVRQCEYRPPRDFGWSHDEHSKGQRSPDDRVIPQKRKDGVADNSKHNHRRLEPESVRRTLGQRQLSSKPDYGAVGLGLVRIDDKTFVLRDLVVQSTPRCVGHFRLPVHTTAAGRPRSFVYRIDQLTTDAATSHFFGGE